MSLGDFTVKVKFNLDLASINNVLNNVRSICNNLTKQIQNTSNVSFNQVYVASHVLMKRLQKDASDTLKGIGVSAESLNAVIEKIRDSNDTDKALEKTSKGVMSLKQALGGVAGGMLFNEAKRGVSEVGRWANELMLFSKNTGVSLRQIQEMRAFAVSRGFGETAANDLIEKASTLRSRWLARTISPEEMAKLWGAYAYTHGINDTSVMDYKAIEQLFSSESNLMQAIIEILDRAKDPSHRRAFSELLGVSGTDTAIFAGQNLSRLPVPEGAVFTDEEIFELKQISAKWGTLTTDTKTMIRDVTIAISPLIDSLLRFASEMAQTVRELAKAHPLLTQAIASLVTALAGLATLGLIIGGAKKLLELVAITVNTLIIPVATFIGGLVVKAIPVLTAILTSLGALITKGIVIVKGLVVGLGGLLGSLAALVAGLSTGWLVALGGLIAAAGVVVTDLFRVFVLGKESFLMPLVEKAWQTVKDITNYIYQTALGWSQDIKNFVISLLPEKLKGVLFDKGVIDPLKGSVLEGTLPKAKKPITQDDFDAMNQSFSRHTLLGSWNKNIIDTLKQGDSILASGKLLAPNSRRGATLTINDNGRKEVNNTFNFGEGDGFSDMQRQEIIRTASEPDEGSKHPVELLQEMKSELLRLSDGY